MESLENISLKEIPQLSLYSIWDKRRDSEVERGIALIKNKKIIKKFPGDFEEIKDERFHKNLSREAIIYLEQNPFTSEEFNKEYFNTPEKGFTLHLMLNKYGKEYIFKYIN